jgi:hypothetical protein
MMVVELVRKRIRAKFEIFSSHKGTAADNPVFWNLPNVTPNILEDFSSQIQET